MLFVVYKIGFDGALRSLLLDDVIGRGAAMRSALFRLSVDAHTDVRWGFEFDECLDVQQSICRCLDFQCIAKSSSLDDFDCFRWQRFGCGNFNVDYRVSVEVRFFLYRFFDGVSSSIPRLTVGSILG